MILFNQIPNLTMGNEGGTAGMEEIHTLLGIILNVR